MQTISEILNKLKEIYPEAIVSNGAKLQTGIYLRFDGIKANEWKKDIANFSIFVNSKSLTGDAHSVIPTLDELRLRTINEDNFAFGEEIFKEIKFLGFQDELYIYALILSIPLYRDNENNLLGCE